MYGHITDPLEGAASDKKKGIKNLKKELLKKYLFWYWNRSSDLMSDASEELTFSPVEIFLLK